MKVALVHDWLTGMRGGERCLQAVVAIYPHADILTLVHVPGATSPEIDRRVRGVSFLNRLPGVRRYYRALLPLFPLAVRGLDLSGYDLVISLSHAAAKNVRVPKDAKHICYCFTPMRYIWDQAPYYLGKLRYLCWPLIAALRRWDRREVNGRRVDQFIAISRFVAARIRTFYGRKAAVIYPPVDTARFAPANAAELAETERPGGFFLLAGALVPYKRPELVVRAFNELKLPLLVVGGGGLDRELRRIAGVNVTFVGKVSDAELRNLYRRCRALVFPGTEDFGIIPVECLASGRPVIALDAGAARETINGIRYWDRHEKDRGTSQHYSDIAAAKPAGVFIRRRLGNEPHGVIEALRCFSEVEHLIRPEWCIAQARKFEARRFFDDWHRLVTAPHDTGKSLLSITNAEAETAAL